MRFQQLPNVRSTRLSVLLTQCSRFLGSELCNDIFDVLFLWVLSHGFQCDLQFPSIDGPALGAVEIVEEHTAGFHLLLSHARGSSGDLQGIATGITETRHGCCRKWKELPRKKSQIHTLQSKELNKINFGCKRVNPIGE